MKKIFEKIFGTHSERELKKMKPKVDEIMSLEEEYKNLTDEQLKSKTIEFKERLKDGESLDDILVPAFATVREASFRVLGLKHYEVQLYGGMVIHGGSIAEMKTGEGKTLVATLAVYLNALEGKGVHVITVNDYLAKRDKEWMGKLYNFLGLSIGVIIHGQDPRERKEQYECDITYGTNNEYGFDYLRDNMVIRKDEMVQRELNFAIIDEVDSILVDEARTPLIISGKGDKSTDLYKTANQFVRTLKNEVDYSIEEEAKSVTLTEEGVEKAERAFGVENLTDPSNMTLYHHINQGLKAITMMRRDKDYVVKDGEVVIVDDFTGRLMFGRRYSEGLHQAIEAKEGLEVKRESKTLATITFQNFFRMYNKLSGMTGTAKTEEEEFLEIYGMDVIEVPTNKPIIRKDESDLIYKSAKGKYNAMIEDIIEKNKKGQPTLVGTVSIEDSESISKSLKNKGIKHEVLNAKQHEREAEIVAQAGRKSAVTIATNMAGRGTDIILGGNPEFIALKEMKKRGFKEDMIEKITSSEIISEDDLEVLEARRTFEDILKDSEKVTEKEGEEVKALGGLHIIGTERHESRRIDNQLRGRAGRQGDPGSSRFFISLEDDLMRLFGGDKVQGLVSKLGLDEDQPIENRLLTGKIEDAQKKVEGRNFGIRKHVLQYDDVMNKQRTIIYEERKKVLNGENLKENILVMINRIIKEAIDIYTAESEYPEEWNLDGMKDYLDGIFIPKNIIDFKEIKEDVEDLTKESIEKYLMNLSEELYSKKEEEIEVDKMRDIERILLLQIIDKKWMDHIDNMSQLKQGINLRAIGQQDPVIAYQTEGFDMFQEMTNSIQIDMVKYVFRVEKESIIKRKKVMDPVNATHGNIKQKTIVKKEKIGRNELCTCGSGKKYKRCCGN